MRKRNEYVSGPHDFWSHFVFGLVFGVVASTSFSLWFFESAEFIIATTAAGALVIAYCCARWGDSAWYWLIEHLPWIR